MSIQPLTFTGVSSYSSDFQTILNRAVSIASLPIQALQNDQQTALNQKTTMGTLRTQTTSLVTSLNALAQVGSSKSMQISSNSSKLVAQVTGTPAAGSYTISDVTSLATTAAASSTSFFASTSTQVAGSDHYLQLAVAGKTYDLNLSSSTDNLNGVVDAINSSGAGVTASIISTGDAAKPYYLSITAGETGTKAIELRTTKDDTGTNLLTQSSPGSEAKFKLNGVPVERSSNTISDAISGVQFTLNDKTATDETLTLTLSSGKAGLENALNGLVSAYNALSTSVTAQTGKNGGALAGDHIVNQLQGLMRQLGSFSGYDGSNLLTLSSLGIEFDSSGVMSFDSSAVENMSTAQLTAALNLVGNSQTGISTFANSFSQLTDPISGSMTLQIASYDQTDQRLTSQISTMTDRVTDMENTLMSQLQAADSLLAMLESQKNMVDASIQSLNLVLYGKKS